MRSKPFQERNHVPVGHAHHLVNLGQRADGVQVRAARRLDARIKLRHHSQQLLGPFQGIKQGQRAFAPYRQRHYRARKQNRIAHRQNRQFWWNNSGCFTHDSPSDLN